MCQYLQVSRSGYYKYSYNKNKTQRKKYNKYLLEIINEEFVKSRKTYGSLRLTRELKKLGISISINTTARYMQQLGLYARINRQYWVKTTLSKHRLPVYKNLVNRNFDVKSPNRVWTSDITYIKYNSKFVYLCVILDLFSRKIISWSLADHMETSLVIQALDKAVKRAQPEQGLIFHSDRGSQYASYNFQKKLQSYNMLSSMSRKGDCWDNAVVESFFKTLKQEEIYTKKYNSLEEIRSSLFEYIDIFYNRKRMHSYLGYKTPLEFEEIFYKNLIQKAS